MENNTTATLLRIYVSSTDKFKHTPLNEMIVYRAKKRNLAGVTVVKGILGYGASSVIHSYKFWEVSEKVPTVVEIVDEERKVISFYEEIKPYLEKMRYGCLVTLEQVNVLLYKAGEKHLFGS
jgi:PII-like signaling protein